MKRSLMVSLFVVCVLFSGCSELMVSKSGESEKRPEQMPQVTAANEMAAISRLRSIANAELGYQLETPGEYATLDQLVKQGLIGDPNDGKLANYRFEIRVRTGGFDATAVPLKYGISGKRSFYVDETRIVRGSDRNGAQATGADPQV